MKDMKSAMKSKALAAKLAVGAAGNIMKKPVENVMGKAQSRARSMSLPTIKLPSAKQASRKVSTVIRSTKDTMKSGASVTKSAVEKKLEEAGEKAVDIAQKVMKKTEKTAEKAGSFDFGVINEEKKFDEKLNELEQSAGGFTVFDMSNVDINTLATKLSCDFFSDHGKSNDEVEELKLGDLFLDRGKWDKPAFEGLQNLERIDFSRIAGSEDQKIDLSKCSNLKTIYVPEESKDRLILPESFNKEENLKTKQLQVNVPAPEVKIEEKTVRKASDIAKKTVEKAGKVAQKVVEKAMEKAELVFERIKPKVGAASPEVKKQVGKTFDFGAINSEDYFDLLLGDLKQTEERFTAFDLSNVDAKLLSSKLNCNFFSTLEREDVDGVNMNDFVKELELGDLTLEPGKWDQPAFNGLENLETIRFGKITGEENQKIDLRGCSNLKTVYVLKGSRDQLMLPELFLKNNENYKIVET